MKIILQERVVQLVGDLSPPRKAEYSSASGRQVGEKITGPFPGYECCSYDDLAVEGQGADLLHLAGRNNNMAGKYEDFKRANVDHACDVLQLAREASAVRLSQPSTVSIHGERVTIL